MDTAQQNNTWLKTFTYQELYFVDYKTYLFSVLFISGNVILPYIFHQLHLAGQVFLPIYFFVLIASYKFGWRVGLMTAIFSPLVSFGLSAMPIAALLPFVIIKGSLLAIVTGWLVKKSQKLSLGNIILAVAGYQLFGVLIIYAFTHNIHLSLLDLKIGFPGLLLQIVGGYFILLALGNYEEKKSGRDN